MPWHRIDDVQVQHKYCIYIESIGVTSSSSPILTASGGHIHCTLAMPPASRIVLRHVAGVFPMRVAVAGGDCVTRAIYVYVFIWGAGAETSSRLGSLGSIRYNCTGAAK